MERREGLEQRRSNDDDDDDDGTISYNEVHIREEGNSGSGSSEAAADRVLRLVHISDTHEKADQLRVPPGTHGVFKNCPRPRGQLEDKTSWPLLWP